jgi:hypothetical protein
VSGVERFLGPDGRLRVMPRKAADRRAALEWLAQRFERGRDYSEKEVGAVLETAHAFGDPALLRRDLFEAGPLGRERDGRRYWRP